MFWLLVVAHASPLVLPEGPNQLVDVDGDGAIDLLMGGGEAAQFGDGLGGFGPVVPLLRGVEADGAHIADLDGDGVPDLCRWTWLQTTCLQGQGRRFGAPLLDLTLRTDVLWATDVDADGDLDLLRADLDGLHQHLNDGSGGFGAPALLHEAYLDRIVEGDVDGDGDLDLVGHHFVRGDPVLWLERLADGRLAAPEPLLPEDLSAAWLGFADATGDGVPDLLHQSYTHDVYVRPRTDDGVVRDPDTSDTGSWQPGDSAYGTPFQLPYGGPFVVADLAGTGSPGLLVGDDGALLWDAALDGQAVPLWSAVDDVDHRALPMVGHLDADGALDVLTFDRDVRVTLDPLGAAPSALLQRGVDAHGPLALGDLSGDGLTDVVYTDAQRPVAVALFATAGGGFGPPAVVALPGPARHVALVDLDRDGALDVVLVTASGAIAWAAGDGAGGLGTAQALPEGAGQGLVVVDADHDGFDEVVLGAPGAGLLVLDDDGAGTVTATDVPASQAVDQLATGDTDGDGWADVVGLARAGRANAQLLVFHGGPIGLLETSTLAAPGREPDHLTVGDLDGDGVASIYVLGACDLGYAYGSPNYPYCTSTPRLQQVDEVGLALGVTGTDVLDADPPLAIADIDGDGIDDLVARGVGPCYGLCAFDGSLDPATARGLSTAWPLVDLMPGDLDGDGATDVLVATADALHIAWNLGAPAPGGTTGTTGDTGASPYTLPPGPDTGTPPGTTPEPTSPTGSSTPVPSADPGDDATATACGCRSAGPTGALLAPLALLLLRRRRPLSR